MRKYAWILLTGAMMTAVLTGCGNSSSADTSVESSTAAESATTASAKEDSTAATDAAEASTAAEEEKTYTADDILSCLSYDVTKYVKLGDYKHMTIDVDEEKEVTDKDIEETMEAFVSMYPNTYVDSDKTKVEDKDVVRIDYTGYLDGKEFDGGSGTDYLLTIGSDTFVDGFEDGLIGAEVGKTIDVAVTFPEDYGVDSLNGKDVTFKVTVNAIEDTKEVTYDSIDDKWVQDNFSSQGCSTLEELRSYIKEYLESVNESKNDNSVEDAALDKMVEESDITIPDGYLEKRVELYKQSVYDTVEESGKSFKDAMGVTKEEFENTIVENMTTKVRKDLVWEALVKDLDISFTESTFNEYVSSYMQYYSYDDPEELYAQFAKLSELDGKDYMLLGYAEHQAWYTIKKTLTVKGDE